MSDPTMNVGLATGVASEGLKDGGHITLSCSNCNALLLDIWRTRPHETEVWKVQATCPFCNDRSFVKEIQGGYHYGGYGEIKPDNEDDDIPSTVVDYWESEDNVIVYFTKKANPDAQAVRRRS